MNSLRECSIKSMNDKILQDIPHWQSDYSIVSKKSLNRDGEKGIAVMQRDTKDTSARHRTGQQMTTKPVSLTLRKGRITEEPNVGKPQVRFCEGC
jgi:hypothetical protein